MHAPDGLDVGWLLRLRAEVGDGLVHRYDGAEAIDPGDELRLPVDVVIPATRQDVIDEGVARNLEARIVVDGANLPTSPPAREVLRERGIVLVPDFVANVGAIVATAVAMDARYSAVPPDPAPIYDLISGKLRANTAAVLEAAKTTGGTPHGAALALARERVRVAMEVGGRAAVR